MEKTYGIAQAARFLGVPASTLRYWEDERLIRSQREERKGTAALRAARPHGSGGGGVLPGRWAFRWGRSEGVPRFHRCAVRRALHAARISIDERLEELERMRRRVGFQLADERARPSALGWCLRRGFKSDGGASRRIDYDSGVNGACSWGCEQIRGSLVDAGRPRELVEAVAEDAPCAASDGGGTRVRAMATSLLPDGAQGCLGRLRPCFGASRTRLRAPSGSRAFQMQLRAGREQRRRDLFDKVCAMGLHPLRLVGRYLLTASDGAQWDWYRCWLECVRG